MSSDDHWQASTALNRLRRAAEMLTTAGAVREIVSIATDAGAVLRELPGDPEAIEGYAAASRSMANTLEAGSGDAGRIAAQQAPAAWQGNAAQEATAALKAARNLMESGAGAMRDSGDLLDEYAATLRRLRDELSRHREDLLEARRELDSLLDLARTVFGGHLAHQIRQVFRAIRGGIGVYEDLRDAAEKLRRGLRDVQGRARAGAIDSPFVGAGEAARLAAAGILSAAQLKRGGDRLDALSTQDKERMRELFANAATDSERAYLFKALAAGHDVAAIERFGARIHGKDEGWLRRQLSLVNPAMRGPVEYDGYTVEQFDGTTCGSTSIMISRAMSDPLYALSLTTNDAGAPLSGELFADRIKAEEQRIHDSTNKVWPIALGTTPWGLTNELNQHGTQYDWRVVDDTDRRSVGSALDAAVGAVDDGHTVPVLIGDGYPRHYVLLIGHSGTDLVFYNPSGEVVSVSEADFRNGNMSALGYRHVQGVVTPK